MPLKVGVSGLFIRTGTVGGAEFMVYNLTRGLAAEGASTTLFVRRARDLDAGFLSRLPAPGNDGLALSEIASARNRFIAEQRVLPRLAREAALDVVLFANYFTPLARQPFRTVTIVHDLQYVHLPRNFSFRKRAWLRFAHRATLRYADEVVVISHAVRDDMLRTYGAKWRAKLHVIPNPIDWDRFENEPAEGVERITGGKPYVLSVASHYPHKNLRTLVRAFAIARRHLPEHRLVLAGQIGNRLRGVVLDGDLGDVIRSHGLSDSVVVSGHVTDPVLGALYRGADLFVLPSLFEGFGMPAVEALGMGLPTLTSACTSLPEVTLGKASYVDDPMDAQAWTARIVEMVRNRSSYVPDAATVADLRDRCAPRQVARQYLRVLSGESAARRMT
ncbi:MAG: glycosyltransferase family 1 protein, partial [Acidobacteria bacterium]